MTDHYTPLTPSPELVRQWVSSCSPYDPPCDHIATQAARWGADQELAACCEWVKTYCPSKYSRELRSARRPKPPSLKEQALEAVTAIKEMADDYTQFDRDIDIIRHALEALSDD